MALNTDNKIFVMHVASLAKPKTVPIYLSCQAQVALLISEETEIFTKYSDFFNVFSSDFAIELPEHFRTNDYPINVLHH